MNTARMIQCRECGALVIGQDPHALRTACLPCCHRYMEQRDDVPFVEFIVEVPYRRKLCKNCKEWICD